MQKTEKYIMRKPPVVAGVFEIKNNVLLLNEKCLKINNLQILS